MTLITQAEVAAKRLEDIAVEARGVGLSKGCERNVVARVTAGLAGIQEELRQFAREMEAKAASNSEEHQALMRVAEFAGDVATRCGQMRKRVTGRMP